MIFISPLAPGGICNRVPPDPSQKRYSLRFPLARRQLKWQNHMYEVLSLLAAKNPQPTGARAHKAHPVALDSSLIFSLPLSLGLCHPSPCPRQEHFSDPAVPCPHPGTDHNYRECRCFVTTQVSVAPSPVIRRTPRDSTECLGAVVFYWFSSEQVEDFIVSMKHLFTSACSASTTQTRIPAITRALIS